MAYIVEMPKLGFDMAEGTLVRWIKAEGEQITRGQVLAEIETDKATVEVESSFNGVVRHHLLGEKSIVPVGTPIAIIGEATEEIDLQTLLGKNIPSQESKPANEPEKTASIAGAGTTQPAPAGEGNLPGGVKASPLARSIAKANAIDLTAVKGSGPAGRIIKRDLEEFLKITPAPSAPPSPYQIQAPPPADTFIPITRLRSAIAKRMGESKQHIPHFYVTHEYKMESLMALRSEINEMLETQAEKISVNDFIIKAVALTLRKYPNLNATLKENQIIHHGSVNIGVAVAMEEGLLTVVCRDADLKPLRQISTDMRSMSARARDGKVKPDEIEGSTFSISNLGMFDVEHFIAIINPPEAAILAVGSVRQIPVIENGQVQAGLRLKATLSVDHRISDGAEAALFLQSLADYLENPIKLLL